MAGSLNRVQLMGRLTREPELRQLPSGGAVCQLGIATNWRSRGASGQTEEHTDFHDVVVWNQGNRKLADLCAKYLSKGRQVYLEGRLQTRSWVDQQTGQKRYRTEVNVSDVQFLDSRGQNGGAEAAVPNNGAYSDAHIAQAAAVRTAPGQGPPTNRTGAVDTGGMIDPDDVPF
jgi:single-strand DNA-binding protein